MTTDELNAIVQAVMLEMEKAGVDFDFKAETPQATDLVYVMRGTSDKYQGITVKWQNLLDIIVQKATEAKNEAVSAKDIALQTLATIQSIESNVSSMKSSVETSEANVASMKASVETSEANVTQMKSDVSTMKASVEGTKTEVEGLKSDVTNLKAQTQTIVDNAKEEVTGLLDTKVNTSDVVTNYEELMASTDLNDVASANAVQTLGNNRNTWVTLISVIGTAVVNMFESQFQEGADRTLVTLQTGADREGGGIIFKHTSIYLAYGIIFNDRAGAKIVKRKSDGTWYCRDIL